MAQTFNWGIIGLGKIAHKFTTDLQDVPGACLYAVASRTQSKADAFAEKHKAQNAYGTYEALAKDPAVDVIYIATPHVFHAEYTRLCLNYGKAVLCEKPIAMNAEQLKQMIHLARQKSVFLMEGLWTNFMPHLQKVQHLNQNKKFGACQTIEADFSFVAEFDTEKRLFNKELGGGALLDIGIYPVYLALKLLGIPDDMEVSCEFSSTGVDVSNQIIFRYASGAEAFLSSSFAKKSPCLAKVTFENATIEFGSRFHETDQLKIISNTEEEHLDFNYPTHGYQFEIKHVQECLVKGLTGSPEMPLQASLDLISTLDKIRHRMGLSYAEDQK